MSRALASELAQCLQVLFPLNRSISGDGNRETLRLLQELVPLTIHEVPTGTRVYDWIIPEEWNINDAWIALDGERIVDFRHSNLHVVSYSEPVRDRLDWTELESHLHRHGSIADAIPYRTSYYHRTWGFCVTQAQFDRLRGSAGPFDVCIDSQLTNGALTYGELLIPGRSSQEILISCYICHPSMANDSLSGVVLAAFLARELLSRKHREYSYRFAFVPETIGAITYCARNEAALQQIDCGLVITTAGGPGRFGYKQSWQPAHEINRLTENVFRENGVDFITYPFDVHGSDERQYSSQGFRINVATICKDRYYEYAEYHSSRDDLSFVTGEQLAASFDLYLKLLNKLEARRIYRNTSPKCEVMLSRRGLYPSDGGKQRPKIGSREELDLILWVLFLADGRTSVDDIAERLQVDAPEIADISTRLEMHGLLDRI